ncbi:MAG: hypothetical protein MZV70_39435 [Desulfobacterales bacterium]|nr:hypothetical protein [Desulfobacterales bacterium]
MKKLMLLMCIALLAIDASVLAATPAGRVTGGKAHDLPDWFKSSFLNFKDDVDEARKAGRHILVSWTSTTARIAPAPWMRISGRATTWNSFAGISMSSRSTFAVQAKSPGSTAPPTPSSNWPST